MSEQTYESGSKLPAGKIMTATAALAADTYYQGMLLSYQADGAVTAGGTNTGNGTVTDVVADATVEAGTYVLTMTAALIAQLEDPSGNIIADNINLADGAATTVKVAGITMTITDGGTAFVATDDFSIAVEAAGEYVAKSAGERIDGIYFGEDERELSSAGYGQIITGGEIGEDGLVDDAGDALTVTNAVIALAQTCGFYIKRT